MDTYSNLQSIHYTDISSIYLYICSLSYFTEYPLLTAHDGIFMSQAQAEAYLAMFTPRVDLIDKDFGSRLTLVNTDPPGTAGNTGIYHNSLIIMYSHKVNVLINIFVFISVNNLQSRLDMT